MRKKINLPLVGAHISIAGGLEKAVERAEALGATTMQVFTKNSRILKFSNFLRFIWTTGLIVEKKVVRVSYKAYKKYKNYFLSGFFLFFLGVFLFFINRNWFIIHWVPGYNKSENITKILKKRLSKKKEISCFYWNDEKLKKHNFDVVLRDNGLENLRLVVGNWLSLLYEERVLEKSIHLNFSALSASEQEVYLSFDQGLFVREWSINKKWQLLDGLCKTISEADLGIHKIIFLVNYEPMRDDHLDFSQPWPVDGFD